MPGAVVVLKLLFDQRRCFAIPVVFYRFAQRSASEWFTWP